MMEWRRDRVNVYMAVFDVSHHMMMHLPAVGTSPLLAGARFSISAKHSSKTLSAGVEVG